MASRSVLNRLGSGLEGLLSLGDMAGTLAIKEQLACNRRCYRFSKGLKEPIILLWRSYGNANGVFDTPRNQGADNDPFSLDSLAHQVGTLFRFEIDEIRMGGYGTQAKLSQMLRQPASAGSVVFQGAADMGLVLNSGQSRCLSQ